MTTGSLKDLAADVRAALAEEAHDLLRRAEGALNALPESVDPERSVHWLELLRVLHTLKGAAAAAGEEQAKQAVHALEERARDLRDGKEPFGPGLVAELFERLETVERSLGVSRNIEPAMQPWATEPQSARTAAWELLRVKPERVEALHTHVGELIVSRLQQESLGSRFVELRDQIVEAAGEAREIGAGLDEVPGAAQLAARLVELSASLGRLSHESGSLVRDLQRVHAQSASAVMDLEAGVRDLLLMPLGPFFEEYGKVVREAGRECGKPVRLSIRAEGAEIDRAVLLRLKEPLLHLVRNAVVHGIEDPLRRRASGKPETGTVLLEAYCSAGRVVIRVADDGGGIDVESVRRKATELRMLDERALLDDEQLLELLCRSGFSTRDTADGLAGRGVGLDVAATCIQELEGRLTLTNAPRGGTIFTIDVPIAASTNLGLVVRIGERTFGVLLHHVDRVLRTSPEDVVLVEGRDVIVLDGTPLAAVGLGWLLGLDARRGEAAHRSGLVLRIGKQRMVLLVEDIPGEQALVIRPLGREFSDVRTILGGAIQADGSILPVLNVAALFELAAGAQPRVEAKRPEPARAQPSGVSSVLVADDSLTMRMLLRNILQAAGYGVTLAHDGRAALDEVERRARFDLIISDLRMPRMDGVDLCRAVRCSKHPHVPFIVVTSVGDEQERQKALVAGADGYIVKADFEQAHFLDLVAKLSAQGAPAA